MTAEITRTTIVNPAKATMKGAALAGALVLLAGCGGEDNSVSFTRSVEVNASAADVWAAIGPYCAVQDWHPAIGSCEEDGGNPSVRTLVTADGAATFVEEQTERNEDEQFYSYAILSGPLPLTDYASTFDVDANGDGGATVTWSSTYVPNEGAEEAVVGALTGIYESGLASIAAQFAE